MKYIVLFLNLLIPILSPLKTATIGLVGDLGLGRHINSLSRSKNNFNWPFEKISSWLVENDFNLANLESPLIDKCPPNPTGSFTFCGDPKFLPYLRQNKLVLNLNNNHILNFGQDGLAQTKNFLQTDYFYDNFYQKEINGIKFGFLGFDFITYPKTDKTQIINLIKKHNPDVDYLIISIHWGNEYLPEPETWRINLAHEMIDAGADIIHGHHPHVYQKSEIYNGKNIYYSLGNFIFDQSWSYETSHTNIIRLKLDKNKIIKESVSPVEIRFNSQPVLSSPTPH